MADIANGVYNLNDELKKEKAKKEAGTTDAYANQLYGNDTSSAAVGSSGSAANSDYSAYLAKQNAEISKNNASQNQTNNSSLTSNQDAITANNAANAIRTANNTTQNISALSRTNGTEKKVKPTTVNTNTTVGNTTAAGTANTPTTDAGTTGTVDTGTTGTAANPDWTMLTDREQKFSDAGKNSIVQNKKNWEAHTAAGDTAAAKEDYIQAQLTRAKEGGFIDDIGDGTGAREFGYNTLSTADRDKMSKEDQDKALEYQLRYMLADNQQDKDYWHQALNELRSSKYGYTSTDGSNYVPNDIATTEYKDTSTFTDPYADQITSLTDYINSNKNNTYDPSTDAAYQSYQDYYTRNANAASQQALANAAANTGGIANSYAQQMANAAAQSYMKQLSDIIPTLQQNYQTNQQNDIANKQSLLNSLTQLQNNAYNQYNDTRDYNFNQWYQNWLNNYNLTKDQNDINQTNSAREDDQAWQSNENELDRALSRQMNGF